ncbi:MAG: peptidoglycan editing factor PgeF [Desulfobacterales bacterium]
MEKPGKQTDAGMAGKSRDLPGFLREKGEIVCYQFPNLSQFNGIQHAVFSRLSGCSKPPFDSLNVGLNVGDNPKDVKKNRKAIAQCLGMDEPVFANQVHGTNIIRLKKENTTATSLSNQQEGDALITDIPGVLIAIQAADCQPVLLYEPEHHVIAAVHSGWRGSIQNIIGRTIQCMKTEFDCSPEKIVGGIGPSLGPCCGEFVQYKKEIPKEFWGFRTGKHHFDFWAISSQQLRTEGVLPENIHISGLCTSCRTDYFYSFRRQGTTGRFAGAIGLTKPQPSDDAVSTDNQLNL